MHCLERQCIFPFRFVVCNNLMIWGEKNNDEKQPQIIRIGSFEDTFDYVDKNGVRRGYGYELIRRNRTGHVNRQEIC